MAVNLADMKEQMAMNKTVERRWMIISILHAVMDWISLINDLILNT
jgi:hypothetical protein